MRISCRSCLLSPVEVRACARSVRRRAGGRPGEVALCLDPAVTGGGPARPARVEISLLEVDAAVAAGDACLRGRGGEGRPGQRELTGRDEAGLDARAPDRKGHGAAEAVAAGEQLQDLRAGRAEVRMAGRVLREGWRREGRRLVGKPRFAGDRLRATAGAAPGADLLPGEEVADGRDRAHRVVGTLVVPGAAAGVEDRVREGEEELDRLVEVVLAVTGAVAVRDLLGKQVPVP